MLVTQLDPLLAPCAERQEHGPEVVSRRGELVPDAGASVLGPRRDDSEPREVPQALRKQCVGESWGAREDLTVGAAARVDVPDDEGVQRSPKISAARAIGQYCP